MEGRQGKDVILSITEARSLRDEIAKLVLAQFEVKTGSKPDEVTQVEVKGGKW
ncbi:MAG: hypothetical protein ACOVLB_04895 [Candidatus Nanopelagicus sp.]